MPDVSLFQPGMRIAFEYPRHNFRGVLSDFQRRRAKILSVRDLAAVPLDPVTVEIQPLLKRSRWLITGEDLDTGRERSFYVESIRNAVPIKEAVSA